MLIPIVGIACGSLGMLIGYAISQRTAEQSAQEIVATPNEPPSTVPKESATPSVDSPSTPDSDSDLDEVKIVLMQLFDTLTSAINELQEGSDSYAHTLEHQRTSLKKTLSMEELTSLGNELLQHVEDMHDTNTRYRTQLNSANTMLQHQQSELTALQMKVGIDFLTGISNRSSLDEHLQIMINISRRYGNEFALIIFDIDHFKRVNDEFGHLVGDEVLKGVAQVLQSHSRECDFLARYGGEEFVYILPEMTNDQALIMAEKLCAHIEEHEFIHEDKKISITLSGGITAVNPKEDNKASIFDRADKALYTAKENGRNRIVVG